MTTIFELIYKSGFIHFSTHLYCKTIKKIIKMYIYEEFNNVTHKY